MTAALKRKVASTLQSRLRLESDEVRQSVDALSDLLSTSSKNNNNSNGTLPADKLSEFASSRRLRTLLETRLITSYNSLFSSAAPLQNCLISLEAELIDLCDQCDSLSTTLSSVRASTLAIAQKTAQLQKEKDTVSKRQEMVKHFLERFQLSSVELSALEEEQIGREFFISLSKLATIRTDCELLIEHYSTARIGLDIMDQLGKRMDEAFEKLYRWINKETATFHAHVTAAANNAPQTSQSADLSPNYLIGLYLLKSMPVYYSHALEELLSHRRLSFVQRFLHALTRGGAGGHPRPIELTAHEPTRYVSDMLAWIHQNIAAEKEFFWNILTPQEMAQNAGITIPKLKIDLPNTVEDEVKQMISRVVDGLSRPLKNRIESALVSHQQSAVDLTFQLTNILQFYFSIISPLLPASSSTSAFSSSSSSSSSASSCPFLTTFSELIAYGKQCQKESLQRWADRLLRNPPAIPSDFSPHPQLQEAVQHIAALVAKVEASLISRHQAAGGKEDELSPILASMITAVQDAAKAAAKATLASSSSASSSSSVSSSSALSSSDSASVSPSDCLVYELNVLHHTLSTLRRFRSAASRLEVVALQCEELIERLIAMEVDDALSRSGLSEKLKIISDWKSINSSGKSEAQPQSKQQLHQLNGMSAVDLAQTTSLFFTHLFSFGVFALPSIDRLLSSSLRKLLRQQIAQKIATKYAEFHEAIANDNGYSNIQKKAILQHSPKQLEVMMEVNGEKALAAARTSGMTGSGADGGGPGAGQILSTLLGDQLDDHDNF